MTDMLEMKHAMKLVYQELLPSALPLRNGNENVHFLEVSDASGDIFLISEGPFSLYSAGDGALINEINGPAVIGLHSLFRLYACHKVKIPSGVDIRVISPFMALQIINKKNYGNMYQLP